MTIFTPQKPAINKEQIFCDAVNEAVAENPGLGHDIVALASKANDKVVYKMVDYFPQMCEDARRINQAKYKVHEDYGYKGKFTGASGFSADGTLFFDYDIPPDLYHFMRTAVYKGFWDEENRKVCQRFMEKICKRPHPMTKYEADELLIKVKMYYGPNSDQSLT